MILEKEKKLRQFVTKQKQKKIKKGLVKKGLVYRVIFEWKDDEGIRQKPLGKSGFDTRADAKKYLEELKLAYANRTGIFEPAPEPQPELPKLITFRAYAKPYLEKLENNTKSKSHKSDMKVLVNYFGDTPLNDIDYELITQFEQEMRHTPVEKEITVRATELTRNPKTNRMRYEVTKQKVEKKLSDSTVNHYVKRLRHLLYTAKRERKIDEKPDFHEAIKPENNKETTAITFAEFERLLAVCTDKRAHLYLQVLCIFEAGTRISEYKAIRKKDLDINSRFCWVNISKQKKNTKQRPPRRCYFSKRLVDAIIADGFENKSDNDFLFDTGDPKKVWATAKRLAFGDTENAERRIKLLDLQMQRSLRKSAATHYLESRILEYVLEYQLSHAPSSISRKHYQEISENLQFQEFQRYEYYSGLERERLITKTKMPVTPANWDFSFLDKQSTAMPAIA